MRMNISRACAHGGVDPDSGVAVVVFDQSVQRWRYYGVRAGTDEGIEEAKALARKLNAEQRRSRVIRIAPFMQHGEHEVIPHVV